ncbi:MAG TPA: SRPBCC family protein [Streptosporangiaceae bacterium]|nr:SRPBCC family protein [Streptosporangiaceae bacterium]
MSASHWHKIYRSQVAAPASVLFELVADMPKYGCWLPGSDQYSGTTDVEPYPVGLGSRYHDGKPDGTGQAWWGTVTGFQPPGSLDFHQTIDARQIWSTIDVHVHCTFERDGDTTLVSRWLVLDFKMPFFLRPLRRVAVARFDKENLRIMAALKEYAEAHPNGSAGQE